MGGWLQEVHAHTVCSAQSRMGWLQGAATTWSQTPQQGSLLHADTACGHQWRAVPLAMQGPSEPRSLGITEGFFDVGGHCRHDFSGVLTVL